MIQIPPGFDLFALIADFQQIMNFFWLSAVSLAAYGLYRSIMRRLNG